MERFNKRYTWLLLLPLVLGITALLQRSPTLTEYLYSNGIYRALTEIGGRIFGLVPISVAELALLIVPAGLSIWGGVCFVKARRLGNAKRLLVNGLRNLALFGCAALMLFCSLCAPNYHRFSFAKYGGLQVQDAPVEQLTALCNQLVDRANRLRLTVAEDSQGVMCSSFSSPYQLATEAQQTFITLGKQYPALAGYVPPPKPVLNSRAMSWLDIGGIYFPFTFEANVNVDMTAYNIPSAMTHELAHFKGFMREEEANFIAYLACQASQQPDFAYSGVMLALVYATNALYAADTQQYWAVMERLSPSVQLDLHTNSQYWTQFEGNISKTASKVNDVYLKTNRQTQGIKSYGAMVDLLLAEYRQQLQLQQE